MDTIDQDTRATLAPVLYDIFCESYGALPLSTVRDEIVFRPGGHLVLYRDQSGKIVGFLSVRMETVLIDEQPYGVLQGGTYFRRGCRGAGLRALWHGVEYCLEYKRRHPLRPVRYVCESLTPASYRTVVRGLPRVYPSRRRPMPEAERRVLAHIIERRGLSSSDRPFVVHYPDPASHQDADYVAVSESLRADPDVRFYLQQNPDFAEGHVLCLVACVDWLDCLLSLGRVLSRSLR